MVDTEIRKMYKIFLDIKDKQHMNSDLRREYIRICQCIKESPIACEEDYFIVAMIYFLEEKLDEARKILLKCLKQHGNYVKAYELLARVYIGQREFKLAAVVLKKIIKLCPQDKDMLDNLGNMFDEIGLREKALEYFDALITIDPRYLSAHNNKAVVLTKMHRINEAIFQLLIAIKIDNSNPASKNCKQLHYNLALLYKKKKEYQKSLESFNKAISIDINYINARIDRSRLYTELKRFREAEFDLDIASANENADREQITNINSCRVLLVNSYSAFLLKTFPMLNSGLNLWNQQSLEKYIGQITSDILYPNAALPPFTINVHMHGNIYSHGASLIESVNGNVFMNQAYINPNIDSQIMPYQLPYVSSGESLSSGHMTLKTPFLNILDFLKWGKSIKNSSDQYIKIQEFEKHMLTIFEKKPLLNWVTDIIMLAIAKDEGNYFVLLSFYIDFVKTHSPVELPYLDGLASFLLIGCYYTIPLELKLRLLDILKCQNIFAKVISKNQENNLQALEVLTRLLEGIWINNISLDSEFKDILETNIKEYEIFFNESADYCGIRQLKLIKELLLQMENMGECPSRQAIREFGWCLLNLGDFVISDQPNAKILISPSKVINSNSAKEWVEYVYVQRTILLLLTIEALINKNSEELDDYTYNLYAKELLSFDEDNIHLIYEFLNVINQVMPFLKSKLYNVIHKSYFVLLMYLLKAARSDYSLQIKVCSALIDFSKLTNEMSGINEALRFIENSKGTVYQASFDLSLQNVLVTLFRWLDKQRRQIDATEKEKEYIQSREFLIIDIISNKWELLYEQMLSINFLNREKGLIIENILTHEIEQLLICLFIMERIAEGNFCITHKMDEILEKITESDICKNKKYENFYREIRRNVLRYLDLYIEQNELIELVHVAFETFPGGKEFFCATKNVKNLENGNTSNKKFLFDTVKNRTLIGMIRADETAVKIQTKEEAEAVKVLLENDFLQKKIKVRREDEVSEKKLSSPSLSMSLVRETNDLFIGLYIKDGLTIGCDSVAIDENDKFIKLMQDELNKDRVAQTKNIPFMDIAASNVPSQTAPVTFASKSCFFQAQSISSKTEATGIECHKITDNNFEVTIRYKLLKLLPEENDKFQLLLKGRDGERSDSYIQGSSRKDGRGQIIRLSFEDQDAADILISELTHIMQNSTSYTGEVMHSKRTCF